MITRIFGFFAFDKKSREFKTFRGNFIESAQAEIKEYGIDMGNLFDGIISGIRHKTIRPSSSYSDISPEFIELAETILKFSPKVGAFLSTLAFSKKLFQNNCSLWGQGELMLIYESMFEINPNNIEKAATLMAYALFMMDHRFAANDTYIHMLDRRMQEITRKKLRQINQNISELVIRG